MRFRLGPVLFMIAALVAGVYLLNQATKSGNPLHYFLSAVLIGMALAAGQALFRRRP